MKLLRTMTGMEPRVIYSFMILLLLSIFLSGGAIKISLIAIGNSNHRFCEVVMARTEYPPSKPGPHPTITEERDWATYLAWIDLGNSIGCVIQKPKEAP